MTETVKYDGARVRLGEREWVVPPLSFRQLRKFASVFAGLGAIGAAMTDEQIDMVIDVVHAALSRNYPDLAREQVEEMLDLGNARHVMAAIAGVSGLVPSGEANPGSRPTGTT